MPIVSRTGPSIFDMASDPAPQRASNATEDPSTGSIFGAAFRHDNLIGSALAERFNFWGSDNAVEEGYSAWAEIRGTQYEDQWERFVDSNNPRHTAALKAQLDMERRDQDTLARGGWTSTFAGFVANVADPTMFIPVGGQIIKAGGAAYKIADVALRSAIAGGIGSAVQEVGLHATQETRTGEESAYAIGGSVILGGLLGAGVSALLTKAERTRALAGYDGLLDLDEHGLVEGGGGLSAAPAGRYDISELSIDGGAAKGVASATSFLSPNLRLNFSPSPVAREIAQRLSENVFYQGMHGEGRTLGPAVSRLARMNAEARLADGATDLNKIYSDMKKAGVSMSRDDFNAEVGRAMRVGDRSDNPFITKAAKSARSKIVEPFFAEGKTAKLYDEGDDVSFAESYFPRQYNRKVLISREPEIKAEWRTFFEGHITGKYHDAAAILRDSHQKLDIEAASLRRAGSKVAGAAARLVEIAAERAKQTRAFLDHWEIKSLGDGIDPYDPKALPNFKNLSKQVVDDVYDRITGRDFGASTSVHPEYLVPIERGPVKERTLPIPDSMLTRQGVLDDDVMDVLGKYARTLSADIELTRAFGDPRLDAAMKRLTDDYAQLRAAASTEAERTALDKALRANRRDLEAQRDLVRGTYKQIENASGYGRTVRVFNQYAFIRHMGGVVIGNFNDLYRPAAAHGLGRFMSEGVAPLLRNADAVKMSVKEAQLAGTVVERVLAQRLMAITGLADPMERGSPIERLAQNLSRIGGTWSGIRLWNDAMQGITAMMTQNQILGRTFGARKLAFLGIDEDMARRISSEFKTHGETLDGVRVANTEKWTDEEAVRHFRAAVGKEVDRVIVAPGVGDLPLFAHTPTGRLLLQFKSYMFAAHQRILISGMQESRINFLSGMVGMTALGMLTAYLSAWRGGEESRKRFAENAKNPGFLIGEGLDRAGFFTLGFDVANTTERVAGHATRYNFNPIKTPMALAGREFVPDAPVNGTSSRYQTRGPFGAVGGPTVGFAEDAFAASQAGVAKLTGGEVSKGAVRSAQSLIPFNSFYGFKEALQWANDDSPYFPEQDGAE